jgi:ergothioneine biosynthesis protein EgtB
MTELDRSAALEWFRRNRARSRALFAMVAPDAFLERPIALRHPILFYEGHLPAFNANTLLRRGLGRPALDPELDVVFERGIDPADEGAALRSARADWPARARVREYGQAADAAVAEAIASADVDRTDDPVLRGGLAVFSILEHEAMHHETLLYMLHQLPYAQKHAPGAQELLDASGVVPVLATPPNDVVTLRAAAAPPPRATVRIPAGTATLGADPARVRFGWDNEFPAHRVAVPEFAIDVHDVTNGDYLEFVAAGGYALPEYWDAAAWTWRTRYGVQHPAFWIHRDGVWQWRGMFAERPLPLAAPVYVSHAEAAAYARWKKKRLPTEAEYHRAAYGTPSGEERAYPWGDEPPDASRGLFDLRGLDPVAVGSFPAGASAWGVHDLAGNGWEWTSTVFAGFAGFTPSPAYPGYSADFFDNRHYVLKGGSPATALAFLRRSWRNWFQPHYPYPYAGFRLAHE